MSDKEILEAFDVSASSILAEPETTGSFTKGKQ